MKKQNFTLMVVSVAVMAAVAMAEPNHGLQTEYKNRFIPLNQQSGWGIKKAAKAPRVVATKPEPKVATPAPVQTKPEPVVAYKPVDADQDGVMDNKDKCLGTPANTKVDAAGCPEVIKAIPEKDWTLQGIQFETGSAKIKSQSLSSLDEAAELLITHNRVVVEIQGHSDNTGKANFNQFLSEKRAQAVKEYLVEKGISPARLEAKGYGETQPIADNKTRAGRIQNRRIDFKVLSR